MGHEAIKGIQIRGGEANYQLALAKVRDTFGSEQIVAQRIVEQLTSRKSVHGAKDMRLLSYQMSNVLIVLGDINALHEIDAHIVLQRIIARIPDHFQRHWEKK